MHRLGGKIDCVILGLLQPAAACRERLHFATLARHVREHLNGGILGCNICNPAVASQSRMKVCFPSGKVLHSIPGHRVASTASLLGFQLPIRIGAASGLLSCTQGSR